MRFKRGRGTGRVIRASFWVYDLSAFFQLRREVQGGGRVKGTNKRRRKWVNPRPLSFLTHLHNSKTFEKKREWVYD